MKQPRASHQRQATKQYHSLKNIRGKDTFIDFKQEIC